MSPSFSPEGAPESEPVPELGDRLDERVVTIPCYEPPGLRIELSGRTLCNHTLLLGMTGSSKTSTLRWFMKDLIIDHAHNPDRKAGMCIIDLNGDDTVALVKKWAIQSGRADDLRLLTPTQGHLDLFAHVKSLEDLPAATAQFMHGPWLREGDNAYWHETARTLIDAALSVCLVVTGRLHAETVIRFLTNWLVANKPGEDDGLLLLNFEKMADHAQVHLDAQLAGKIDHVRATIEMWGKLDARTRGILASCLLDALGPLVSLETRKYIDSSRGSCFNPEEIDQGRILVFSLPAGRNVESASLLGQIVKARLYVALQNRPQFRDQRLCGIVVDEYHYLASGGTSRASDVTALATLRSRSVAIIAATQSLDHLASIMGPRDFRALIPNFGSHFFFRSTEFAAGELATIVMGSRDIPVRSSEQSGTLLMEQPAAVSKELVCPPGALAQLEPGQAYVATASGFRSDGRIWLAGNHEEGTRALQRDTPAPIDALGRLRRLVLPTGQAPSPPVSSSGVLPAEWPFPNPRYYYDTAEWHRLIQAPRFLRAPYPSLQAFRGAFNKWGQDPSGLDTLPICWWEAVLAMTLRFVQLHPMKLIGLHQQDGCLCVLLSEITDPPFIYLTWTEQVQNSVYPARTRPLKRRDQHFLQSDTVDEAEAQS